MSQGLTIAGRSLRIGPPTQSQAAEARAAVAAAAASITGGVNPLLGLSSAALSHLQNLYYENFEDSLSKEENLTISGNQRLLISQQMLSSRCSSLVGPLGAMTSDSSESEGTVLMMSNMLTTEDLDDPIIKDEISKECQGSVSEVILRQENPQLDALTVYVVFTSNSDAKRAFSIMNHRYFSGKKIQACVISCVPSI